MHRFGVTILGVLNQKNHQKRNDGRSSIDDQLPRVGEMKDRAGEEPNNNNEHGTANAQALPSIMAERCAKTRNASLTTQKKSRSCSCCFSSAAWVLFTIAP